MPDTASPLAGRRVLIVEDEYIIAMGVKRWLQQMGAEVVGPAPTVQRALDLIEDDGIDAALLDVNLGDGTTACPIADRLSALGVPFLFATGDIQVPPTSEVQLPRLIKPFTEMELLRAVSQLLAPA